MADKIRDNLFLINAPAGSGKTTTIYQRIEKLIREEHITSILCITYTNRAVEELQRRLEGYSVKIMTIHAFLSEFMKPYFSNSKIVKLYLDLYKDKITEKIERDKEKSESGKYYKEKYGKLEYETITKNITKIYYNEREFNSLYDGGVGHDDLLSFSVEIEKKYPVVRTKLTECFKYIFLDEYQDTSANVLDFFYDCIKDSKSKLYLFGDQMQQIYDKYDGSFQQKFEEFDTSEKLRINYRSTPAIINLLNNIYGNDEYAQMPPDDRCDILCSKPRLIITDDVNELVKKEEKGIKGDVLKLYVTNKERFLQIGAGGLYSKVENLKDENDNKLYGWGRRYSVQDVLTKNEDENPEVLFRFLFTVDRILQYFKCKEYCMVIQILRNKETGKDKFFQIKNLDVKMHSDKQRLKKTLEEISDMYEEMSDKTILQFIQFFSENNLIERDVAKQFFSEQYQDLLNVPVKEFVNLCRGLERQEVSTQHGVKGEGHEKVFFIAEDCQSLGVAMYEFFKMNVNVSVEFQSLQKFYYDYKDAIQNMKQVIEKDFLKSAKDYRDVYESVKKCVEEIDDQFAGNRYYEYCYQANYRKIVKSERTFKYISEYANINKIKNILLAYKLFYVGCSRAKKELTVFVSAKKVEEYKHEFIHKFRNMGFEISE